MKKKELCFEYSSKESEIFDKFLEELFEISIPIKGGSVRPFGTHFSREDKNTNKVIAKIYFNDFIGEHLITDEEKKKELEKDFEESKEKIYETLKGNLW